MKPLSTLTKFFLIPLLAFALLRNAFTIFLGKYVADPLFSHVAPASPVYDVALLVLLILASVALYKATLSRRAVVPLSWISLLLAILCIYLYYRFIDQTFEFTAVKVIPDIKLLDATVMFSVFVFIASIIAACKKHKEPLASDLAKGFHVDEARIFDSDNDQLDRGRFVDTIIDKLEHTTTITGSFPIGVMARWGSGKTTFINTLIERLDKDKWIVVNFNVWKCSSPAQVVDSFFSLLRQELDQYSFTLARKLQHYTTDLLKGIDNEKLGLIRNVSDLFSSSASLEKQYNAINKGVKALDKKIIVIIDDLDRLDKQEIYEVIRIVRNTANFSNTFFIVAYDRNYILNAIEEINPYQSHYFLEKIFQVEFTLPPIPPKTIEAELARNIIPILSGEDKAYFIKFKKEKFGSEEHGLSDLTPLFVHNFRDIVRFVNGFKLTYEWVKDEVYFPDFFNLELIRFKHPELFIDIYRHFSDFFTTENKTYTNDFQYGIRENGDKVPLLKAHLQNTRSMYKLTDLDISVLVNAYRSIFLPSNYRLQSRYYGKHAHLTVINPSKTERYFLSGINGALSEVQFSKIRALPFEAFKNELKQLSENSELSAGVKERFLAIKDYDSREDFEKIFSGIFYFANQVGKLSKAKGINIYYSFNGTALSQMVGSTANARFYSSKEEYKAFIRTLLKSNSAAFTYTDSFLDSLMESNYYNISQLFEPSEIAELSLSNFQYALTEAETIDMDLWFKFLVCKERKEEPQGNNTFKIRHLVLKKAKQLLRQFIFEKCLDDFLLFSIERVNFQQKYHLDFVVKNAFNSPAALIRILRNPKHQSAYKEEYIRFYDALTTDPEYKNTGVPIAFFKQIPVGTYDHQLYKSSESPA